ncbi:hypothetical protein CFP56_003752 [Quercus suber]|uniref:Uncharacterized protein n=1 Tax=Quercus suber TaxID=58331 RepID=A0AAW0LE74_QUESU
MAATVGGGIATYRHSTVRVFTVNGDTNAVTPMTTTKLSLSHQLKPCGIHGMQMSTERCWLGGFTISAQASIHSFQIFLGREGIARILKNYLEMITKEN